MTSAYFITHPDVVVDPVIPIERWPLSERGRGRMQGIQGRPWLAAIAHVFCSAEQKALDGAEIIREARGIAVTVIPGLGENDRSATGFLEPAEFWEVVDEFFAKPDSNVRGWEAAADAQARVFAAVEEGLAKTNASDPVAFVAHGGVGTLLLCRLKGVAITRTEDQPAAPQGSPPGSGGGYYFAFDRETLVLQHGWRDIAGEPDR
jgi:broad specificity phosphatase PhoE